MKPAVAPFLIALLLCAPIVWAEGPAPPPSTPAGAGPPVAASDETGTVLIGEVVDLTLWLGRHEKGGAVQADAVRYARGGSPAGFLTPEGDLYVLLSAKPGASPLGPITLEQVGRKLKVAGEVVESGDVSGLVVHQVVRDYGLAE